MSQGEYRGGEKGLTDVEDRKAQAEYVLGDPTLFPLELLNWLKRYIEQSGIMLPASQIIGGGGEAGSLKNYPPGLIFPYVTATPPVGSIKADGSSVLRATYPKLFALIGTSYGSVDATHFTVPDYRDRMLVGIGTAVPAVTSNDGLAAAARSPKHRHAASLGGSAGGVGDHSHSFTGVGWGHQSVMQGTAGPPIDVVGNISPVVDNVGAAGGHGHSVSVSGSVGPAGTPQESPAYHGVLYVITTG